MSSDILTSLKKELRGLQENVLLKDHTTFNIGGPAEYFFVAFTKEELLKATQLAKNFGLPIFILGGGSNLLVKDRGIEGLVIKVESQDDYSLKGNVLSSNAGVELKKLVELSVLHSLKGLEWAGGLPGSLGGAVRGNAGAFGGEMKDSIIEVEAFDQDFVVQKLSHEQSHFSYRSSLFKEKNWVVISATMQLAEGNKEELEAVMNSHINYRKERHPLELGNAGSIFKNMDVKAFSKGWQEKLVNVVKNDPFPVIPTAYLIAEAGLKGKTIGKAQVSEKHPNFMVNLGGATAQDVLELIDIVKKAVKEKYQIDLETEVQIIGF